MQKRSAAAALLVTVAALVGLVATPAMAVDRPPSPGGTAQWGQLLSTMKSNPYDGEVTGGWTQPNAVSITSNDAPGDGTLKTTPLHVKWSEPYHHSDCSACLSFTHPYVTGLVDNRNTRSANLTYGSFNGDLNRSYVVCQATEWSTTQQTIYAGGLTVLSRTFTDDTKVVLPSDCRYVVKVVIIFRVVDTDGLDPSVITNAAQFASTWTAERWYTQAPYDGSYDPISAMCNAMRYEEAILVESCKDVVKIPLESYCASPPSWDLWVGETYGDVIAFYADCLFHPRGGWDENGDVTTAWEASAGGKVGGQIEHVYEGFTFSAVCGPIINMDFFGTPFQVNTCQWTSWAEPVRVMLWWGVWIGFAFWVISFVTRVITGLTGSRMPTPVDGDDK